MDGGQDTFDQPDAGKMLTISELCDRVRITRRAARYYEQKQLIAPERRGNIRLYSQSVTSQVERIIALKKLGLSLTEIRDLLRSRGSRENYGLTPQRCLQLIESLKARHEQVDSAIRDLGEIRDILTRQNDYR